MATGPGGGPPAQLRPAGHQTTGCRLGTRPRIDPGAPSAPSFLLPALLGAWPTAEVSVMGVQGGVAGALGCAAGRQASAPCSRSPGWGEASGARAWGGGPRAVLCGWMLARSQSVRRCCTHSACSRLTRCVSCALNLRGRWHASPAADCTAQAWTLHPPSLSCGQGGASLPAPAGQPCSVPEHICGKPRKHAAHPRQPTADGVSGL